MINTLAGGKQLPADVNQAPDQDPAAPSDLGPVPVEFR